MSPCMLQWYDSQKLYRQNGIQLFPSLFYWAGTVCQSFSVARTQIFLQPSAAHLWLLRMIHFMAWSMNCDHSSLLDTLPHTGPSPQFKICCSQTKLINIFASTVHGYNVVSDGCTHTTALQPSSPSTVPSIQCDILIQDVVVVAGLCGDARTVSLCSEF